MALRATRMMSSRSRSSPIVPDMRSTPGITSAAETGRIGHSAASGECAVYKLENRAVAGDFHLQTEGLGGYKAHGYLVALVEVGVQTEVPVDEVREVLAAHLLAELAQAVGDERRRPH